LECFCCDTSQVYCEHLYNQMYVAVCCSLPYYRLPQMRDSSYKNWSNQPVPRAMNECLASMKVNRDDTLEADGIIQSDKQMCSLYT